jgi:hypothetical protein
MIRAGRSCVLEVTPVGAAVVRCFTERRVLDLFPHCGVAIARIAPDELWLIGPASARAELAERARSYVSSIDPDGVAVDQSDGWMAWTVSGVQATTLLARLSSMAMPPERPAFLQGAVAEIPAKVLMESGRLHLLVPAQYGHHISGRIRHACADLHVRWSEPRELALEHHLIYSGNA